MSVFDAKSYRSFIDQKLDSAEFGRGAKTRLAEHLGVKLSFVSLVLAGRQEFAAEHGLKIARFFELNEEETRFLILLIHWERAVSPELKSWYRAQLDEIRSRRSEVQNQIQKSQSKTLSDEELADYYESWVPTAVHMLLRNPKVSNEEAVSRLLMLPREEVVRVFGLLQRLGFIVQNKGKWVVQEVRFHWPERSPALKLHHTNWRLEAIRDLALPDPSELHFTSVMSIDRGSMEKIKKTILQMIREVEPMIESAKDESVYALNVDFFSLPILRRTD